MRHLILSDIHANAVAIDAILEREEWDSVIILGDVVEEGPEPAVTISKLMELRGIFLAGNHDRNVLSAAESDAELSASGEWQRWTRQQLSRAHIEFLSAFDRSVQVDCSKYTMRCHHGDFEIPASLGEWDGRLWPDTNRSVFEQLAAAFDERVVIFGHSHVQFERHIADTRFVNPGSVGQPRLGTVEACYAICDDGTLQLKSEKYDAQQTIEAMSNIPLEDEYLEARSRVYREGRLPEQSGIRDLEPLERQGYQ